MLKGGGGGLLVKCDTKQQLMLGEMWQKIGAGFGGGLGDWERLVQSLFYHDVEETVKVG